MAFGLPKSPRTALAFGLLASDFADSDFLFLARKGVKAWRDGLRWAPPGFPVAPVTMSYLLLLVGMVVMCLKVDEAERMVNK